MPPPAQLAKTFVGLRIQERRLTLNLTQMQLGVHAGIDETSASARVNQYERGKHLPDLQMAKRLADVLQVPLAYLFCDDDELAAILRLTHGMSKAAKKRLIAQIRVDASP
jgi:transcriptional regulator with XRE-family HTH domain